MRWKPVIILLLLLLLSIGGGAVFHHHYHKHPGFPEIDSYLRNEIASGDWVFASKPPGRSEIFVKYAWWNKIGIRPKAHYEMDLYLYKNLLTDGTTLIVIGREDGKVVSVQYGGEDPVSKGFQEILCRKFPHLRHPSFNQ